MDAPFAAVSFFGMRVVRARTESFLEHVSASRARGQGGYVLTANLDILRRYVVDPAARALYETADLTVADGMPLVWASQLLGEPLPERLAGASLALLWVSQAAREGQRVYLLGGDEGAAEGARAALEARYPGLQIVGCASPQLSAPPSPQELSALADALLPLAPDLCLVALGSPKQEYVCRYLRGLRPQMWSMGVGATLGFASGQRRRAPPWMQRVGLEWLHRLASEPRRLARRYLIDDLPFAFRLFAFALRRRLFARPTGPTGA